MVTSCVWGGIFVNVCQDLQGLGNCGRTVDDCRGQVFVDDVGGGVGSGGSRSSGKGFMAGK